VDPVSLALLKPPGAYGVDVAVGEGQSLGNDPNFGGPSFGFFATRQEHVRKVPGRIVGETRDRDGRKGYVLTFQTREQHIRRERATSNICTNQGLASLRGAIYLAALGEHGLRRVSERTTRMAHLAHRRISSVPGVRSVFEAPFFGEFALSLPRRASEVYHALGERGVVGGLPLDRYYPERKQEMLFACTELTQIEDIHRLEESLRDIL
jgi:glycine dehydrogenase subunit 1